MVHAMSLIEVAALGPTYREGPTRRPASLRKVLDLVPREPALTPGTGCRPQKSEGYRFKSRADT